MTNKKKSSSSLTSGVRFTFLVLVFLCSQLLFRVFIYLFAFHSEEKEKRERVASNGREKRVVEVEKNEKIVSSKSLCRALLFWVLVCLGSQLLSRVF